MKRFINVHIKIINKTILSLIIIETLLSLYLIAQGNPTFRQTLALATSIKPETFTELYFENHLNLPETVEASHTYTFAFTVHNVENQDMTYPYVVLFKNNNFNQILDQGSVSIKNSLSKTISITFTGPAISGQSMIAVVLQNKDQQIDFQVNADTITPEPTVIDNYATLPTPKPEQKVLGAWYWQPDLHKSLMWLGLDSDGKDIWSNGVPTPTNTPSSDGTSSDSSSSDSSTTDANQPTSSPVTTVVPTQGPQPTQVPTQVPTQGPQPTQVPTQGPQPTQAPTQGPQPT